MSRYQFLMLAALLHSGSWTWSGTPETNPHGWDLVKTGAIPTVPSPDTRKHVAHPLNSARRAMVHSRNLRYGVLPGCYLCNWHGAHVRADLLQVTDGLGESHISNAQCHYASTVVYVLTIRSCCCSTSVIV